MLIDLNWIFQNLLQYVHVGCRLKGMNIYIKTNSALSVKGNYFLRKSRDIFIYGHKLNFILFD